MDLSAFVQQLLIGRLGDKLISQEIMTSEGLVLAANAATSDDGATWRSLDTAKSSWRLLFDPTNDRVTIQRAAATTGNLTWVTLCTRHQSSGMKMSGDQSVTSGAEPIVVFDTIDYEHVAGFGNTASYGFTAPLACHVEASCQLLWPANATGSRGMRLVKNASVQFSPVRQVFQAADSSAFGHYLTLTATVPLAANDVLKVLAYQSSGGPLSLNSAASWFSARIVSY